MLQIVLFSCKTIISIANSFVIVSSYTQGKGSVFHDFYPYLNVAQMCRGLQNWH
jgi:hypothetical protein